MIVSDHYQKRSIVPRVHYPRHPGFAYAVPANHLASDSQSLCSSELFVTSAPKMLTSDMRPRPAASCPDPTGATRLRARSASTSARRSTSAPTATPFAATATRARTRARSAASRWCVAFLHLSPTSPCLHRPHATATRLTLLGSSAAEGSTTRSRRVGSGTARWR